MNNLFAKEQHIILIGEPSFSRSKLVNHCLFIIRYRLHFQRESREEIDRRKKLAQLPIVKGSEESLEIPIEQIYRPGSALDMPIRPTWTYQMTKEELNQQEQTYFNVRRTNTKNFFSSIDKRFLAEISGENLREFRCRTSQLFRNESGNMATTMAND